MTDDELNEATFEALAILAMGLVFWVLVKVAP